MSDMDALSASIEQQVEGWGLTSARDDAERTRARAEGWGLGPAELVLRKLVPIARAVRDRVTVLEGRADQGAQAIQDLRARVKALEDAQP